MSKHNFGYNKIAMCDCKSEVEMEIEMENNFFFLKKKVRAL